MQKAAAVQAAISLATVTSAPPPNPLQRKRVIKPSNATHLPKKRALVTPTPPSTSVPILSSLPPPDPPEQSDVLVATMQAHREPVAPLPRITSYPPPHDAIADACQPHPVLPPAPTTITGVERGSASAIAMSMAQPAKPKKRLKIKYAPVPKVHDSALASETLAWPANANPSLYQHFRELARKAADDSGGAAENGPPRKPVCPDGAIAEPPRPKLPGTAALHADTAACTSASGLAVAAVERDAVLTDCAGTAAAKRVSALQLLVATQLLPAPPPGPEELLHPSPAMSEGVWVRVTAAQETVRRLWCRPRFDPTPAQRPAVIAAHTAAPANAVAPDAMPTAAVPPPRSLASAAAALAEDLLARATVLSAVPPEDPEEEAAPEAAQEAAQALMSEVDLQQSQAPAPDGPQVQCENEQAAAREAAGEGVVGPVGPQAADMDAGVAEALDGVSAPSRSDSMMANRPTELCTEEALSCVSPGPDVPLAEDTASVQQSAGALGTGEGAAVGCAESSRIEGGGGSSGGGSCTGQGKRMGRGKKGGYAGAAVAGAGGKARCVQGATGISGGAAVAAVAAAGATARDAEIAQVVAEALYAAVAAAAAAAAIERARMAAPAPAACVATCGAAAVASYAPGAGTGVASAAGACAGGPAAEAGVRQVPGVHTGQGCPPEDLTGAEGQHDHNPHHGARCTAVAFRAAVASSPGAASSGVEVDAARSSGALCSMVSADELQAGGGSATAACPAGLAAGPSVETGQVQEEDAGEVLDDGMADAVAAVDAVKAGPVVAANSAEHEPVGQPGVCLPEAGHRDAAPADAAVPVAGPPAEAAGGEAVAEVIGSEQLAATLVFQGASAGVCGMEPAEGVGGVDAGVLCNVAVVRAGAQSPATHRAGAEAAPVCEAQAVEGTGAATVPHGHAVHLPEGRVAAGFAEVPVQEAAGVASVTRTSGTGPHACIRVGCDAQAEVSGVAMGDSVAAGEREPATVSAGAVGGDGSAEGRLAAEQRKEEEGGAIAETQAEAGNPDMPEGEVAEGGTTARGATVLLDEDQPGCQDESEPVDHEGKHVRLDKAASAGRCPDEQAAAQAASECAAADAVVAGPCEAGAVGAAELADRTETRADGRGGGRAGEASHVAQVAHEQGCGSAAGTGEMDVDMSCDTAAAPGLLVVVHAAEAEGAGRGGRHAAVAGGAPWLVAQGGGAGGDDVGAGERGSAGAALPIRASGEEGVAEAGAWSGSPGTAATPLPMAAGARAARVAAVVASAGKAANADGAAAAGSCAGRSPETAAEASGSAAAGRTARPWSESCMGAEAILQAADDAEADAGLLWLLCAVVCGGGGQLSCCQWQEAGAASRGGVAWHCATEMR